MSETYTKEEVDKLLEEYSRRVVETVLKSLPYVVRSMVVSSSKRHELAMKFYEDNPDLAADKPFTAQVIEEVDAKYPGASFEEVLKKSAKLARERMTLRDKVSYTKPSRPDLTTIDSAINGVL